MSYPSRLLRLRLRLSGRWFSSSPSSNSDSNPSEKNLRSIFKALSKENDLDKLVSDFINSSDCCNFRRKQSIYETTVRRLSAAGRHDAIEEILEHQKIYPDFLSSEGFAARLISLYGRATMLDHAAAVFQQHPSVLCFNALLTSAGDRTSALFSEIPLSNPSIVPNVISYNILISAHCEKGDLDAALGSLDLMENAGVSPNLITFNTLLNGFYGKGRFSDGEKIWATMHANNIDPDTRSFNSKLRGLVLEGRMLEAVELLDELKLVGLKPDTFTYNALIKGYCVDGNLEEAKRVYKELGKNNCAPNYWTFKTLIPKLCEAGEVNLAFKLCNESLNSRCFVEVCVLQPVVDGLVRDSRLMEAKRLVEHGRLKSNGRISLRLPLSCLAL